MPKYQISVYLLYELLFNYYGDIKIFLMGFDFDYKSFYFLNHLAID